MKRSTAYPERRSNGEFRLNCERSYSQIIRDAQKQPKGKPEYLKDYYGVKKEKVDAERN